MHLEPGSRHRDEQKHFTVKLFFEMKPNRAMLRTLVIVGFALMMASSCARNRPVKHVPRAPATPVKTVHIGDVERGIASWYGEPYHGRRAANGETYDMNQNTAAHRTMPFETWVRVDNLTNGKSVEVRIIDRGPFVDGRIIDLSRKAAEQIAMIGPGTAKVKLTVIEPPPQFRGEKYGVQVVATEDRSRAEQLAQSLSQRYEKVRLREGQSNLYRVVVGEGTREQAEALLRRLRADGYAGFVARHVP